MIKNIIFDWDGVINDSLATAYNAIMMIFEKHGAEKMTMEEFKKNWEQPYMVFFNRYIPHLNKEEVYSEYKTAYRRSASKYPPKPYLNIKETLQKFKKAQRSMVIVSSGPPENILSEIKGFGLQGIFHEVNGAIHDKTEFVKKVLKRNNFSPGETVFIGDTTHEIKAGKSANIKTGAVTWGFQNEDVLKSANPDFIIHDLEELERTILM